MKPSASRRASRRRAASNWRSSTPAANCASTAETMAADSTNRRCWHARSNAGWSMPMRDLRRHRLHAWCSRRDFRPATRPPELLGRGIGLDVVHRAVVRLRGTLDIRSEPARGLGIGITLPIALAGLPVLVARTPTHVLALSIRQVEHIMPGAGVLRDDDGAERFVMEHGVMPVRRLDELLGLPRGWFQDGGQAPTVGAVATPRDEVALLVRGADGGLVAVIAPELSQTRRVVVRPLPSWPPAIAGVEGACVLGDGSAAPVIDLPQLLAGPVRHRCRDRLPAGAASAGMPGGRRFGQCSPFDGSVPARPRLRGRLRRVMAWRRWRDWPSACPTCAIVDLEMPRMNGVELASTMRQDERSCEVPIIMITSRASESIGAWRSMPASTFFSPSRTPRTIWPRSTRRCLERKALLG